MADTGALTSELPPRGELFADPAGVALTTPPSWFHGEPPAGGFMLALRGAHVMAVRPRRSRQLVLAQPWEAITFISRALSPEDPAKLTGKSWRSP